MLLFAASLLWSLGGLLVKSVDWNPMAISGVRSTIAAVVIAAFTGLPKWPFSRVQIAGGLAYAGVVIAFVFATRLTTAANAIFLQYTAPIYVAALSHRLLGERALRSDWLIIGIALAGIVLFFFDHLTLAGMWGNCIALGSGVCFAALVLLLRWQRDASPVTALFLGNVFAGIAGLPFFFLGPYPSAEGWWALAALGVFQLGLPYVLYSYAIKRVTALEAVLLPLLEPILNPLWVMLLVGERPGGWALIGAGLVLGAVLLRGLLSISVRKAD
jgi:drug/metabolite transporter (DMT)-like permease